MQPQTQTGAQGTDKSADKGATNGVNAAGPYFRPRRLAHVNLWVEDVERVARFYRDVAGVGEAYRRDVIKAIFLSNGNTYHDFALMDITSSLGKSQGVVKAGIDHFAFELENEVELVNGYDAALAAGKKFAYTMSADVAHSVYGLDPDGNCYEVYADVVASWRTRRRGEVSDIKPKWTPGSTPPVAERCYADEPQIDRIEEAIFHTRRTAHVCYVMNDYAGALKFYTEFMGLQPLVGGPEHEFTILGGSLRQMDFTVFRARPNRPAGLHHVGLEVAADDDFVSARKRLERAGIRVELEIDHPLRRCLYVRDPDGRLVQFFVNRSASIEQFSDMEAGLALHLT
jgi:catechol 2,3-dioxygenase